MVHSLKESSGTCFPGRSLSSTRGVCSASPLFSFPDSMTPRGVISPAVWYIRHPSLTGDRLIPSTGRVGEWLAVMRPARFMGPWC